MLGAAQEQWLTKGLAQERARWSLVTQQTLFSRVVLPTDPNAVYSDFWDGYGATRDRVTAALTAPTVRNSIVLRGDVPSSWVTDVQRDFARPDADWKCVVYGKSGYVRVEPGVGGIIIKKTEAKI